MKEEIVKRAKYFLKESFVKHPHFSFGDWRIMYNHSIVVMEFALKIAKEIPCDTLTLSVGALLHDMGKTYEAETRKH